MLNLFQNFTAILLDPTFLLLYQFFSILFALPYISLTVLLGWV